MDLKTRILEFLYNQVQEGKIPHIRKNMAEDFEEFIQRLLAEQEADKMADRMAQKAAQSSEDVDSE